MKQFYQGSTRRSGLSIVELLAATVLAVLLVVAVLSVLRTVTVRQSIYQRKTEHQSWHARLHEQLEWDFNNSRSIRPLKDGFELTGFAGRDPANRTALHCPAIIQYTVHRERSRLCFLRTEIHPAALSLENQKREFVCLDISGVVVGDALTESRHAADDPEQIYVSAPEAELSGQIRVALYAPSQATPVYAKSFVLN